MITRTLLSLATAVLLLASADTACAGEVKHYQLPEMEGTDKRTLSIYLPEGYSNSEASYPVLYLLHGDEGSNMTFLGKGYNSYMSDANVALSYKVMGGIEYETKYDTHFLDADSEDSLLDDYNDFIEEMFWDELVYRMGQRDLLNAVGEKELSSMELKERIAKEEEHMEKYRREFEENGIRRIAVPK